MFWVVATFEGGLAVLAVGLAWAVDHPLPSAVPRGWETTAFTTGGMCLFYLAFEKIPLPAFETIRCFLRDVVTPMFAPMALWKIWTVAFLAGLGEEMLFRGFLQSWLAAQGWSPLASIGLAAGIFGVVHWITPLYAVIATLIGAVLGVTVWWTGDLGAAIFAHGFYDGFALTRLTRNAPKKLNSPNSGGNGELD